MNSAAARPSGALDLSGLASISSLLQAAPAADQAGLREVPIGQIQADPNQPRKHYDAQKLEELANSIRVHGIIQPLVLRSAGGDFIIVAGERRWRAAKAVPLTTVPAIVRNDLSAQVQMVENLQREDLTPFEIFRVVAAELDGGMKQKELADAYGKSKSWVSEYASVAKMPLALKEALRDGRAGDIHALAELGRLYKRAPAAVDELLNSGAAITRHAVHQLSQSLVQTAETVGQVAEAAQRLLEPLASSSPSAGPAARHVRGERTGGVEAGRNDLRFLLAPHIERVGATSVSVDATDDLAVVIDVEYDGRPYRVRYDQQRGDAGKSEVKLVGVDGKSVYAPLDALVMRAIRARPGRP